MINIYLFLLKEEGAEVIVDTAEAEAVAAIEVVVDMTMVEDTTITTGMEVTDTTMGEVEAEDVVMVMRDNLIWNVISYLDLYQEVGVVVVMEAVVDMITEVVTATEMVVTKEFCISQQHSHTVTNRAGGHASDPPCPSLCGEFSCTIFCVFSICLKFYVAFLNPF